MHQRTPITSKFLAALLSALLFFALGCQQETPPEPLKSDTTQSATEKNITTQREATNTSLSTPRILFSEPIELNRFESISEALPVWREFADQQPVLLLLSDKPQLIPPPEILRGPIDHLVTTGSAVAINAASNYRNPEALLQSSMAVDIALRNGWFQELNWVFPSRNPDLSPNLELIREQFTKYSILDTTEATSLVLHEQIISGTLRNKEFKTSALKWMVTQHSPVIVHIDLSYFQTLYKNEIATPILQTIYNTLSQLRDLQLNTLAVTFSYSHMDNKIALDVRFLGEILTTLIAQPDMLDKPVPPNWQRQADAIYLANFFQKETVEEIFKAQQQDDSNSAWVKFNLYRSAAEMKAGDQALDYLAKAVAIDPVYALEYARLSQMAYDRERPDEALRMLSLAAAVFPDDPFIKLRIIQLAHELGEVKTAQLLLEQLQELTWSEVYYANMPERLNTIAGDLKQTLD